MGAAPEQTERGLGPAPMTRPRAERRENNRCAISRSILIAYYLYISDCGLNLQLTAFYIRAIFARALCTLFS